MMFIQQLRRSLRTLGIPARTKRMLVAVSGGADSVALLVGLQRVAPGLGIQLRVAHLHHGLRGAEADADARFVRALAKRLKILCVTGRADVRALARKEKISIEMAARAARYAFLADAARRWGRRGGAAAIATAHTMNDQAETVLLRLARGAGLRGLAGIPPERLEGEVRVVRPLLGVRRAAIEVFLKEAGQAWREDSSNDDRAMLRNRVRHEVLPLLAARLNPRIVETLARTAEILRGENESRVGASLATPAGADKRRPYKMGSITVRVPGETRVPELGVGVETCEGRKVIRERGKAVGALPARASIAWARLGRRKLVVRSWRAGDRMAPLGMAGSKKLQDVFVDAKVPAARRGRVPVFACGGEIVWIPGYRVARGWEIRGGERILEIRVAGEKK